METVICNVRDLTREQHSAAEQLVGHDLLVNQKIVIHVVDDLAAQHPGNATASEELPEWCNVYDGLTNKDISDLEKSILRRADRFEK